MEFSESQRFTQWWVWIILLAVTSLAIVGLLIATETEPAEYLLLALPVMLLGVFYSTRLDIRLDDNGIEFRFFPFHLTWRKISWREIEKIYVRRYKPIREFGGWGMRYSFHHGRAFNVKGNWGIQIELKSGQKILLGTQLHHEWDLIIAEKTGIAP